MGWLKKFGPAQNILGPVKGQGIKILQVYLLNTWPTFVLVVYASNEFLAGFFGISETWVRHVTVLKVRRRF